MSARKTVVRTTSANEQAAGLEQRADVVEHAARLRGDVAVDHVAGRRIERHLAGDEQQLPARTAGEYGPIAFGALGLEMACLAWSARLRRDVLRRLDDLAERRQRVQTRIRLMPPLIIARTVCRFGSNRRALTLFAWLCCRPTTGAFPANLAIVFAITALVILWRNPDV